MENFKNLGLDEDIVSIVKSKGFNNPTEIQEKSIPLILEGKDVVGSSFTGSGKTFAFVSGIIQSLKSNGKVQALILTPTRELAEQVKDSFREFSKNKRLFVSVVYGGVDYDRQVEFIKKSDVVVGTPGRILDHLNQGTLNLNNVKFLVLDEADRMVDMGFINDIENIISYTSNDRQNLFFSATMNSGVKKLFENFSNKPVFVKAKSNVDPSLLEQEYYFVDNKKKFPLLANLLEGDHEKVMIFCNTRQNVDFVVNNLKENNFDVEGIHGGFTQNKRNRVIKNFNSGNVQFLVCTDVAARGLDIPFVSHVYNYDIPKNVEEYTHRIGRTARAGNKGKVVNIVTDRDHDFFSRIFNEEAFDIEEKNIPELKRVIMNFNRNNMKNRVSEYNGRNDSFRRKFNSFENKKNDRYKGNRFRRRNSKNSNSNRRFKTFD